MRPATADAGCGAGNETLMRVPSADLTNHDEDDEDEGEGDEGDVNVALAPALGSILVARGGFAGAPPAKRTRHSRLCRRRPTAAVALARAAMVDLTGDDSSDDADGGAVAAAPVPSTAGTVVGDGAARVLEFASPSVKGAPPAWKTGDRPVVAREGAPGALAWQRAASSESLFAPALPRYRWHLRVSPPWRVVVAACAPPPRTPVPAPGMRPSCACQVST